MRAKRLFSTRNVGERNLLTEGVTPTTAQIHLLRYGLELKHEPTADEYTIIHVPVPWLREINLVDTPGTERCATPPAIDRAFSSL